MKQPRRMPSKGFPDNDLDDDEVRMFAAVLHSAP
jgi:hypothetical protein